MESRKNNYYIKNFINFIEEKNRTLINLEEKLKMLVDKHLKEKNHILQLKKEKLSGVNPKEVLKRGYTITVKNGKVIKDKNEVQSGEVLETHFYNGKIESIVKE